MDGSRPTNSNRVSVGGDEGETSLCQEVPILPFRVVTDMTADVRLRSRKNTMNLLLKGAFEGNGIEDEIGSPWPEDSSNFPEMVGYMGKMME